VFAGETQARFPRNPGPEPANPEGGHDLVDGFHCNDAIAGRGELRKIGIHVCIELSRLFAQGAEVLDHSRVLCLEHRQNLVSNPNPLVRPLVIRRVIDERKPLSDGVCPHVGSATIE
jgi:hypothetical protein